MPKSIKVFVLPLFVAVSINLHAQPVWFPENTEWYYTIHCPIDPLCGYLYYYTAGDTVINGKPAVIVGSLYEGQLVQSYTHYFRMENDTVFYYSDDTNAWGMLYDFNAQPGDVWDLTETLPAVIFDTLDEGLQALIVVDSVNTEMLGGMMRRVIHTSPLANEPYSHWMFNGPIVEGIGPVGASTGLLGELIYMLPGGHPPAFSCYLEHEELVHGNDSSPCGIVSGIEEENYDKLGAYPNPTTQHLWLDLPSSFAFHAEVSVYNAVGQLVQHHAQFSSHEPLSLQHPPGLYIVEARKGDNAVRAKVVVR